MEKKIGLDMQGITGHMTGLYNLVADYKTDTVLVFSDELNIKSDDIKVTLRRTDISAQVIVSTPEVKKHYGTKIVFIVNRLDEYDTFVGLEGVLHQLLNLIKIKDRGKKIKKLQSKI